MANTVFLRLEGPLQAWGERGQWSVRDTAPEPTKSGVIGLVGCALGYKSDDPLRRLADNTRMAVRCDAPGRIITDYHTVGGGYDTPTLLTAEGKPKVSSGRPHTEITWRDYLCDASFLVALQADDEALIEQIAYGLQHPVWPVYLGRKSCPPTRPVYDGQGQFATLAEALAHGQWSETIKPLETPTVRGVIESEALSGVRRRDHLLSRRYRRFGPRYTVDQPITLIIDIMKNR